MHYAGYAFCLVRAIITSNMQPVTHLLTFTPTTPSLTRPLPIALSGAPYSLAPRFGAKQTVKTHGVNHQPETDLLSGSHKTPQRPARLFLPWPP